MEKAESSSSTTHHQIGNVNGGGAASPAEIGMIRKSKSNDEDEVEDEEVDDEEEEESAGSAYEAAPHLDRGCEPDEANICEEEEQKVLVPLSELTAIKANLQLLNHQMSAIVRALNVKPCGCTDCGIAQKLKIGDLQQQCQSHNGHLTNGFAATADNRQGQQQQHQVTQNSLLELSGESTQRGRRSKYCTPTEKKAVAEYVRVHGASAAAKKFNIPPAVAAYYHRRQFKMATAQTLSQMAAQKQLRQSDMAGAADSSGESERMPLADGSQYPEENKATMNNQQLAQFLQNTPHAYLRGRGRGRPKLIGDELDAELVEHIVKLKQQHNCPHLTASQALVIARNYISSKAAGILEEHGGQVKLKITWAMKLVTRVQEREREIQLGLPPGTLQNLPRSVLNASGDQNTSNANALDELLGQNLLNQQISNVSAILAAASSAEESQRGGRTPGSSAAADAAMLNAMLGMGSTGNAAELFGLMEQQQPGTSKGTQQQHMHHMRTENMETNMEEQDAAIRQLLASLQGEGVGTGAERQHEDGGVGVSEAGMDMATLAHQLTG